jgi:hypothetical protein
MEGIQPDWLDPFFIILQPATVDQETTWLSEMPKCSLHPASI